MFRASPVFAALPQCKRSLFRSHIIGIIWGGVLNFVPKESNPAALAKSISLFLPVKEEPEAPYRAESSRVQFAMLTFLRVVMYGVGLICNTNVI